MSNNIHQHVTYDEIEKYVETGEEELKNNLDFFREIEKRLDTCQVCDKRYRAYNMLLSLTREDLLEDNTADIENVVLDEIDTKGWIRKFLNDLRGIGELVCGNFTIAPRLAKTGASRGIGENLSVDNKSVISITRGGDNRDMENNITIKEGEDFFEFELSESTALIFTMSAESAGNTYELVLCHEKEGATSSYSIKKTFAGIMAAVTDKLSIGKYAGVVMRYEKSES